MKPNIVIGGIWHETNTFASGVTTYQDFQNYQLARDDELIGLYQNSNTELGGIVGEASSERFTIVPTLYAAAVPSAIIENATAMRLCDELAIRIGNAKPLDGVILTLHGAAVAQGIDDFDSLIVDRVRQVVGNDVPIVATYDFHANLSDCMVNDASVLIGYDTYPHIDMAERGKEAVQILMSILETGDMPHAAFRRIPLLTLPLDQQTDEQPMMEIMNLLFELEKQTDIVCGSVAMGFPYSDVPYLGASVLVYGNSNEASTLAADTLASKIWNSKEKFEQIVIPVELGDNQAIDSRNQPVVIVESADNVGGGSAGDGTGVLKVLLESKSSRSVVVVADPEAVQAAESAGVGNRFVARIGGKTDDRHGPTLEVEVVVKSISDGRYVHKGSYMTGYVTNMGRTAVVETNGVQIILTSLRTMPFDAEQLRCVGIEPANQKIIVVKSAVAWKSAYGDLAEQIVVVDTPGVCPVKMERLNYHSRNRPLYPLEQDTEYMN